MTVIAFYLRFILLTALSSGIGCIYFSQRLYIFTVDKESQIVGQVVAINNVTEGEGCKQGAFRLTDEEGDNSELFKVNTSGWISVADDIDTDSNYNLVVSFMCYGSYETSTAMVEVHPNEVCQYTDAVDSSELRRVAFNMCFQQNKMELYVEENKLPDTLGNLAKCQHKSLADKLVRQYDHFDHSILHIDNRTTALKLKRKLDRENESSSVLKYNITCVTNLTDASASFTSTSQISIYVADVNDSPPLLQNEYKEVTAKGNQVVEALIIDKDVTSDKDFKVDVVNDTHGLCKIHMLKCLSIKRDQDYAYEYTCCRLMINISSQFDTVTSNNFCKILIVDSSFVSTTNKSGTAVLTIFFLSQDKSRLNRSNISHTTFISGAATKYAKVYTQVPPSAYILRQSNRAFRLKYPGIVYIFDVNAFQQLESPYNLTMESETHIINLKIIKDDIVQDTQKACNLTCARYMDKSSCTSACGIGSPTGKCQWRSGNNISMTMTYSTCVPDINTCPDGICDSVEQLNPSICPQDCTLLNVVGEGELDTSHNPAMGIKRGTSPCWCDYTTQCSCFRPSIPEKSNQLEIKVYNSNSTKQKAQSASPSLVLEKENSSSGNILPQSRPRAGAPDLDMHCDWNCRTTIAATGGCIGAIMCVIFLAWRLKKTRCQKSKTLKHVDSIGSISGMPSDYLDDRDYRTTHSSPHWSPKRSAEYSQTYEDYKWEFPREKLVLEKTLGEGEFGRVVKAKAYGLNGKEGYKDVAVKMLKNCAASGELQDLLSEFNLLKDVNHSNVIRLLGACTKGGPCYVIVEFCEHGSLLHYLRGARLEENGYVNHRLRRHFRHQTETGEAIETELLNIRHLLSFAWQIAKGMRYLSEIKLVHRDLAARNILVGSGKVLKISDFGLTRDVYEADTYFKKSKGRIPVKWLAPESLYAQIYTTQSDVWSFGIVLWEIVTLGAPPYPGIPPERLYNLLIAGYRMDRPEGCSDELYAVMQKCWKSEPAARPIFADLGTIFDQMLQQRTEYLEITGGFEDANPDLFDRHFDNTNVTDQVNNSPANGNPYLTPTSAVDKDDESDSKPRDVKVRDDLGQSANMKHKTTGSTINESENVALLLNSRTVVFSNSFDSEEDLNVRQTGLGQTYT